MPKVIDIQLDTKSIKQALKQMQKIEKKFKDNTIVKKYLNKSADYIITMANQYLSNVNIDGAIISDIQNSWVKSNIIGNTLTITNTSEKAVYLEFGIGIIGQGQPHPNASVEGYEYNVNSGKKDYAGRWRFRLDEKSQLDIISGYYENSNNLITTKGYPAVLYLYNAIMDFRSSGAYKLLWQQTLEEEL